MLYAAFLRAINVGTANRIRMDDLKTVCASAGCANIETYLQSGNLVFAAEGDGESVALRLEAVLQERGLKNVHAVVRSLSELAAIVGDCPFDAYADDEYRRFVTLFRAPFAAGPIAALENAGGKVVAIREREVITVLEKAAPPGIDVNGLLAKQLRVPATTRYWNVARGVLEMMERR